MKCGEQFSGEGYADSCISFFWQNFSLKILSFSAVPYFIFAQILFYFIFLHLPLRTRATFFCCWTLCSPSGFEHSCLPRCWTSFWGQEEHLFTQSTHIFPNLSGIFFWQWPTGAVSTFETFSVCAELLCSISCLHVHLSLCPPEVALPFTRSTSVITVPPSLSAALASHRFTCNRMLKMAEWERAGYLEILNNKCKGRGSKNLPCRVLWVSKHAHCHWDAASTAKKMLLDVRVFVHSKELLLCPEAVEEGSYFTVI